jgi:hypothetical protein
MMGGGGCCGELPIRMRRAIQPNRSGPPRRLRAPPDDQAVGGVQKGVLGDAAGSALLRVQKASSKGVRKEPVLSGA